MISLADLKRKKKEPPPSTGIVLEWEDLKTILKEEDPDFDPKDFDRIMSGEDIKVEVNDPEVDLMAAVELIGRFNDLFQCLDMKKLKASLPQSLWKAVLELDNDIIEFLNNMEEGK
jgi:hypothetical protein